MSKKIFTQFYLYLFLGGALFAQFDENSFFSDANVVAITNSQSRGAEGAERSPFESKHTLSGQIEASSTYSYDRHKNYLLDNSFQAMLGLDVRLTQGYKAYISLVVDYYPSGTTSLEGEVLKLALAEMQLSNVTLPSALTKKYFDFGLNEFFIDANVDQKIWFRFGKQLLKWGPGYFWNPSDLINVDRKTIDDLERAREGVTGLKMHIPYKTLFNFYAFADMNDFTNFNNWAYSLKAETTLAGGEMAISGWFKQNEKGSLGFECSRGMKGWNGYLEGVADFEPSEKRYVEKKTTNGNQWKLNTVKDPIYKVSLGANKSFNRDKFYIGTEFFYTSSGYSKTLNDESELRENLLSPMNGFQGYYPNELNRFYGALFLNYTGLAKNTLTLGGNLLMNLEDRSGVAVATASLNPVDNFTISVIPTYTIGAGDKREFTITDQMFNLTIKMGVTF